MRVSCNSRCRRLFSMAERAASTVALAWSTLPPSHAFQLRVIVIRTARASTTTRRGVTYFFHPTLPREAAAGLSLSGGNGFVTGAADSADTGEADIKFTPSEARNLQTLRYSLLSCLGSF